MADTQRTRAAILALFADNVTGNISEQDQRDFIVTLMEQEFANPGDFWKQPAPRYLTNDKSSKGWKDYSQIMLSACSFRDTLYLTESGTWAPADAADSTKQPITGLAGASYAAGESQATILRGGIVYDSALSATFSGLIGRPLYAASGTAGGITTTKPTNVVVIGLIEPDGIASTVSSKWRFQGNWGVVGS